MIIMVRVRVWLSLLATTILFVSVAFWPSGAAADTWYVRVDGTGDAPTIQAAIDSAAVGDSIVVAPGIYELAGGIDMKNKGLTLVSEMGPHQTILVPKPGSQPLVAIDCFALTRTAWVVGFWFKNFVFGTQINAGTLLIRDCDELYVRNNVFTNCAPSAVQVTTPSFVRLENNTFTGNAIGIDGAGLDGVIRDNIVWDDVDLFAGAIIFCNDFLDLSQVPETSRLINFQLDPMFCDEAGLDLRLQPSSPCIPNNSPLSLCTIVLGALPVGCTVPTERETWGGIKSRYVE